MAQLAGPEVGWVRPRGAYGPIEMANEWRDGNKQGIVGVVMGKLGIIEDLSRYFLRKRNLGVWSA